MTSPKSIRQRQGEILRVDFRKASSSASTLTPSWRSSPAVRSGMPVDYTWRQSERLFSQVFVNSPQPMSITTLAEGQYLDVNETFLSLLGYSREEVIGQTSI